MNMTNLVFGLCLVFIGAALGLDRLGVIEAREILQFWPLGIVLLGVGVVLQALRPEPVLPPGTVDQGRGRVRRDSISMGHIIGLVILGLVLTHTFQRRPDAAQFGAQDTANVFSIMGRERRVSQASPFRGGQMTTVMGHSELDLRQASIQPGEEAVIDVFGLWGGLIIRVPDEWEVDVRTSPIAGGVNDRRGQHIRDASAPRLVIHGFIMMGGLSIRS